MHPSLTQDDLKAWCDSATALAIETIRADYKAKGFDYYGELETKHIVDALHDALDDASYTAHRELDPDNVSTGRDPDDYHDELIERQMETEAQESFTTAVGVFCTVVLPVLWMVVS